MKIWRNIIINTFTTNNIDLNTYKKCGQSPTLPSPFYCYTIYCIITTDASSQGAWSQKHSTGTIEHMGLKLKMLFSKITDESNEIC